MRTLLCAIAVGWAAWSLGSSVRQALPAVQAAAQPVTWNQAVAPIVYAHCASCHHAGGSGPFMLTSYADARRWGPQITDVVGSRYMPPWLPESTGGPHPVHFEGDRRLKSAEIEALQEWVRQGMPEGTGPAPAAPVFASGWQMGPPDLVLEMPVAVTEPASGSDLFVNFILPAELKQTRWVRAMEIQPGAGQLVHHANALVDRTASLRAAHPHDWQQGIPGMDLQIDSGEAFDPDSHFLFWKPDSTALVEPEGMPWRLDPGNDLVLNMHLKPTGKPEQVRARIGIYFTPKPAVQKPILIQLEHDAALQIPAGDAHFAVTDELKLPVAVDLLGIYPHAHYLGHEMEAWADLPGGEKQPLLLIKDWDIDRQAVYRLAAPLSLPAGAVLHMRYTYDNSAANVHNPHSPPVPVHSGNKATDEMSHLWLQVLPHPVAGGGDPRLPVEQAWMENNLRKNPDDPIALYNLGALEQMQGHPAEAASLYRRLLVRNPHDARALTALGSSLEAQGDTEGAAKQFNAARAENPANMDATYDLAGLDLRANRYAEAEGLFRLLLTHQPEDVAARSGLAEALLGEGRPAEAANALKTLRADDRDARAHRLLAMAASAQGDLPGTLDELRAWVSAAPADPEPHRALAQVLSAGGDARAALAEAQIVVHLSGSNAGDWSNLGVLAARAGDRGEAQQAFHQALQLDPANQAARANLAALTRP